MQRYFYAFDSIAVARHTIARLTQTGVAEQNIAIVSRPINGRTPFGESLRDLVPRSARGAASGIAGAMCIAASAMWLVPIDAVTALLVLAMFVIAGGILGAWIATPVESTILDGVPRALQDEIDSGRTLLVVDAEATDRSLASARTHLIWQCRRPRLSAGVRTT
jgi:hypothetical protein